MKIGPLGTWEILIILLVILLFFGPRRLPEMARGIGQSVREFRKGIREMKEDVDGDPGAERKASTAASREGASAAGSNDSRAEQQRAPSEQEVPKV